MTAPVSAVHPSLKALPWGRGWGWGPTPTTRANARQRAHLKQTATLVPSVRVPYEDAMSDPFDSLRRDVDYLGHILGDTLVEQAGPELLAVVEEVRQSSAPVTENTTRLVDDSEVSASGENRLLSIYGLVSIGSDMAAIDPGALIVLFAMINVFIGVFNLVPLLPFDGGHVAIAVYERIQEVRLRRRRYLADVGRLIPFTYAVVVLMGMLFVSTIYLDIANPLVAR